ncbi:MAG: M42 family metallopeptidase, partial [Candidatus Hodarchaeota archaeon]
MTDKEKKEEPITIPEKDKKIIFDLAKELTGFCCPTGFEDEIRKYIVKRFKDRCKVTTDKIGNVFVEIKGKGNEPRPKFMLSAHIDEIGFMVSFITKDGFLRITPLGGQNYRILPGQRVTVFSDKGEFQGVIAEKPIHLLDADERKKLVKADEIFVDIGASSKEKALEFISIGDYLTFQRQCEWLGQGEIFSCKGGDDRMGTLVEILVLEYFIDQPAEWDVIGVFSTQEEIGTRGAITSAYAVEPDAALALEVTHAIDFPGISKEKFGDIVLGKGSTVAVGPNLHPKL